jgi:hypothetical protein
MMDLLKIRVARSRRCQRRANVEPAEQHGVDVGEVAGEDGLGLARPACGERSARLGRRGGCRPDPGFGQDAADGAGADPLAEPQQFASAEFVSGRCAGGCPTSGGLDARRSPSAGPCGSRTPACRDGTQPQARRALPPAAPVQVVDRLTWRRPPDVFGTTDTSKGRTVNDHQPYDRQ